MRPRRDRGQGSALNLIPVLNLVSMLIPFLLASVQFAHLAAIDATPAAIGPLDPEDADQDKPPLHLALIVERSGVTVAGADWALERHGLAPEAGGPHVTCRGACTDPDDFDWPGLVRTLARIKDEYPAEDDVVIVPADDVPYAVVVAAMDHARSDRGEPGPDGAPRPLFPRPALAPSAP